MDAPILDPVPSAEDFDVSKGDYATQLADIMARITRLHMRIAENVQRSTDIHKVEERIHTVLNELQAVGDETLEMASDPDAHQVNQLQQFAVDSRFVRDGSHPPVERGLPGIHTATSQGKRVFSTYAKNSFSLPLVGLSDAEHSYRLESLNTVTVEHFDTDENSRLLELELQSSAVLNPSGMHHVWIGVPGPLLHHLILSDRRVRVHVFTSFPVNSLYDSLPPDVWHRFVSHRHNIADITADLISATLSRELVRLDVLLSVHHEASDDGPSLDSVLFRLPVSDTCIVSEMRGGNFRVVKAWQSLRPELVCFKILSRTDEFELERPLGHYDELRVHQYSMLIEAHTRGRNRDQHIRLLEEVCHLLGPFDKDMADDDDGFKSQIEIVHEEGACRQKSSGNGSLGTRIFAGQYFGFTAATAHAPGACSNASCSIRPCR